jgi:hypothetical protein
MPEIQYNPGDSAQYGKMRKKNEISVFFPGRWQDIHPFTND